MKTLSEIGKLKTIESAILYLLIVGAGLYLFGYMVGRVAHHLFQ